MSSSHDGRHVKICEPRGVSSISSFSNIELTDFQSDVTSQSSLCLIRKRNRTISGSKSEDHLLTTESGRRVYTKGRPPWYDREGRNLKQPYVIGICGGSASGKTTVARRIIEQLEIPWVTVLSMDSFYKVLTEEQHHLAARQEYNFDHPQAFDFDLMCETVHRLREGKSVEVFVDTDPDTRLARRLKRDISERGRDVDGVLEQYFRFVKPAFETFIAPGMKVADIIVPRGGENQVAIDLIVKQIKIQLAERGYDASENLMFQRADMVQRNLPVQRPESLTIVSQTPQVLGLHTFIRNKNTPRDELIFYTDRLIRILIENAMNFMPFEDIEVQTVDGLRYNGKRRSTDICGIAIMRAGETMENSLRAVVKDCKMGKILIQTNQKTMEPELYYLRLPKNIENYKVFLLDATVATGAAAMMAIRILLDHDVLEENIILISLLMAESGVHALAYAFPKVRLITAAVDAHLNEHFYVIPGIGNFGDRYYGTEENMQADQSVAN